MTTDRELIEHACGWIISGGAGDSAGVISDLVAAIERLSAGSGWLPIKAAPKSTVEHGSVRGKYLLGYLPDDALDPQGCMSVIWWEPLAKAGRGCWYSDNGDEDARPTHFMPLPAPPSEQGREEKIGVPSGRACDR